MIHELRILPPLAIARFGGAPTPMDNYDVVVDPANPLGYRRLEPAETLELDVDSGEIARVFVPEELSFKEGDQVRPVAPFLEVWALTGDEQLSDGGRLEPLTLELLEGEGAAADRDLSWQVEVANLKVFRRTGEERDRVTARTGEFSDHARRPLIGRCRNFLPDKTIGLGHVQFVKPTAAHPEIRLRFTPAAGFVYGSNRELPAGAPSPDPNLEDVVYDADGPWNGHLDFPSSPNEQVPPVTAPPQIYAGHEVEPGVDRRQVSDGYLDDGCDGIVRVSLEVGDRTLRAFGRLAVGPPTYAPDAVPIRTVADELEQALFGPEVNPGDATFDGVEELVRRSFETIRLLDTGTWNVNPNLMRGSREPIIDRSLVDPIALENLHQSLLVALRSKTVPWFADVLRNYDEAGDLTAPARRKMPAMMRGADAGLMTLTRRQVDLFRALARGLASTEDEAPGIIEPANLAAQLHYRATGNQPSTQPASAVSNCFPGLEFDFRNLWRQLFEGIELHEASGLVVKAPEHPALLQGEWYLLDVGGVTTRMRLIPPPRDGEGGVVELDFMEWSNALADIVAKHTGETVRCTFGNRPADPIEGQPTQTVDLVVRPLFVNSDVAGGRTALIDEAVAQPGELTQSLCSPWQNDYVECACYYWAASRPDYVNVEPTSGGSRGEQWLAISPETYAQLFQDWQTVLRFIVGGRDSG